MWPLLITGIVGIAVAAQAHKDYVGGRATSSSQLPADAGAAGGHENSAHSPFYLGAPGPAEMGGGDIVGEGLAGFGGAENPEQAEAASLALNHPPINTGSPAEEEPVRAPVEAEAAVASLATTAASRGLQPPTVTSVRAQPAAPTPPVVVSSEPQPSSPAEPTPPTVLGSTPQPQAPGEPVIVKETPQPRTHG